MAVFVEDRAPLPNICPVPPPLSDLPWNTRPILRGVPVFREGEPADSIFLLESGLVKLTRNVSPQRTTIVRLVRPGELIGDRALGGLSNQRYTAEVVSDGAVWEVSRARFLDGCNSSQAALTWVTEQVERRLAEVERRVELITYVRVEYRLLALLADLAEATAPDGGHPDVVVQIPLSQAEIAQMVGATRETASTTLNQLERKGLVRLGRRQIEVVSLPALREAFLGGASGERALSAHA